MERIARVLCATRRDEECGDAVRQAEAIARAHQAELSFFPVGRGEPVTTILRRAAAWDADLVVLQGARPESEDERRVDGVVRHTPCSVLVARPSPETGNVLVAADLDDPALPAVTSAVDEVRRRQGHLLLVHNADMRVASLGWGILTTLIQSVSAGLTAGVDEAARHRMTDALDRAGARGDAILAHGAPAATVLGLAVTLPAELVVIGTPGESSIRTVLFGSLVETVVRWAPCSVLVVPTHVRFRYGPETRPPDAETMRETSAVRRSGFAPSFVTRSDG